MKQVKCNTCKWAGMDGELEKYIDPEYEPGYFTGYICPHCSSEDIDEAKEPAFKPKYFSGLNWRELMDRDNLFNSPLMYSDDAENWNGPYCLKGVNGDRVSKFKDHNGRRWVYCKTCPETHAHPTITIGGMELPRPEIEAPKKGTEYWVHLITGGLEVDHWSGCQFEFDILAQGRVHLKESRAQAWADWWVDTVIKAVNK